MCLLGSAVLLQIQLPVSLKTNYRTSDLVTIFRKTSSYSAQKSLKKSLEELIYCDNFSWALLKNEAFQIRFSDLSA